MSSIATRAALAAAFLSGLASSAAAGQQGLSLSPAVVTLSGRPGQSTRQTLKMTNVTARPLTFALEARDVVVRRGQRVFVRAGELRGSIAATAVFSATQVAVPAGESRAVQVTLTLPPDTTQRAVVVLFRGLTRIGGGKGRTAATVSLGTLFTFTLSDQVAVAATDVAVRPQTASSNLGFEQTFVNSGQEPVVLKGMTVIVDGSGAMVGRVPAGPHRLLPGERAALRGDYAGELARGRYRALSTFEFEGRAMTRAAEFVVR